MGQEAEGSLSTGVFRTIFYSDDSLLAVKIDMEILSLFNGECLIKPLCSCLSMIGLNSDEPSKECRH